MKLHVQWVSACMEPLVGWKRGCTTSGLCTAVMLSGWQYYTWYNVLGVCTTLEVKHLSRVQPTEWNIRSTQHRASISHQELAKETKHYLTHHDGSLETLEREEGQRNCYSKSHYHQNDPSFHSHPQCQNYYDVHCNHPSHDQGQYLHQVHHTACVYKKEDKKFNVYICTIWQALKRGLCNDWR